MLEILQYVLPFIFSSFWKWLGTVILCAVIFGGLGLMFSRTTNIINKNVKEDKLK